MNNYFPKKDILKGKIKFANLFKNGNFLYGKNINVLYICADDFKIGFAVSRKIRGSVNRNKIKRHLREIYRNNKISFPQKIHLVIIVKKNDIKFNELTAEILSIVESIK